MVGWDDVDRHSFWAFHEAKDKPYRRIAYIKLGSDADAEDAVDKAFDYIMGRWQWMLGIEHLHQYAWAVLNSKIVDQQRARQRRAEPADIAPFEAILSDGADAYDYLTGTIHFYTAVRRLSERQRDAVILRYGLDYSTRDTALVMGIEEATVRSQLRLARNRLVQLLGIRSSPNEDRKVRT
ncbi:sigma-70 family RNA polymerase sigma factor [Streptomyces sp. NPDC060010]|uniref:sigma-70 family RNA polymerase sigma factor n=1 Tax=Streptomyces sp. NPDC060010 TaxID=3347036 RepID=UPI0036A7E200